jgi:hypothetical protein
MENNNIILQREASLGSAVRMIYCLFLYDLNDYWCIIARRGRYLSGRPTKKYICISKFRKMLFTVVL